MITIIKDQLMVEQYEEVLNVTSQTIRLKMKDTRLTISGERLKVLALTKDEILIQGIMEGLQFHHAS